MDLVKTIKVLQGTEKLRQSPRLSEPERAELKRKLESVGPAAIQPLFKTLSHADARGPALEILGELLNNSTLSEYLEALASPNPAVVSGVTQVLRNGDQYDPSGLLEGLQDGRLPRGLLESLLLDKAARLKPRKLLELMPIVDKPVRVTLFRLLERCATAAVIPDLGALLQDEDWWVRLQAAKVIATLASEAAEPLLSRLLTDANNHVRLQAVNGLRTLGAKQSVPALVAQLRDHDFKVQSAVIDALIEVGDASCVPHLLQVLTDDAEHARRGAVEVLNELATPEAIHDLIAALRDKDWWVRVRAADALGTLGGANVVEAVIALLGSGDDFQRRYVVEILNAVPHEKAVLPLIDALRDSDWWVRERAIDALGNIGDPRAAEPLIALAENDPRAAALCAKALGLIGDASAMPVLAKLRESDRDDVRREAKNATTRIQRKDSGSGGPEFETHQQQPVPSASRLRLAPEAPSAFGPAPASGNPARAPRPDSGARLPAVNYAKLEDGTVLLDRYTVLRRIGSGGFGVVYLVEDSAVQEQVILKVLNPQLSVDERELRRFIQELKLTRRVAARNVIRIFDFLDLGGVHAVSMEYFPGQDLGRILAEQGRLPVQRTLHLVAQMCQGIEAAHVEGVVHRDIKPPNVLVDSQDMVKIVDFGLAWVQQRAGSRITKSGLLIGTPEYMAPELIREEPVDHRADIYSLGIVMYEMLSGKKPFASESVVKVLFQHLEGEAECLESLVPGIPEGVAAAVKKAMARDANDRPQCVQDLRSLIELELGKLQNIAPESHG